MTPFRIVVAINADGSYSETDVSKSAAGSITQTESQVAANGQLLLQNVYTPSANGSYWEDSYQYSQGGSAPGATGVSFTESFYESTPTDTLQGSRQYDASSAVTTVSWNTNEVSLSGTTSDSGFYGLQNDQEFTLPDPNTNPTFFNPAVNPGFNTFLNGH